MRGYAPQQQLEELEPGDVKTIVKSLSELHSLGKPTTDEEVSERIDSYFQFCENSSLRPGIEGLCLALHVSRTTLYRWANGEDCSQARQEVIQTAKAFISAFIESALMNGKISPPSGIFLMKNWCNYKDTISIEENSISSGNHTQQLTASQLPVLKAPTDDVVEDIAPRHSKILSGADLPKL